MRSLCDMTVADTIIASHVGGYLCWADDIVDRDPMRRMWEGDIDDLCPEFSEFLDSATDSFLHSRFDTLDEILFRNSDSHSGEISSFPDFWIESYRI